MHSPLRSIWIFSARGIVLSCVVFNEVFSIHWRSEVFHIVQSLSTTRQCETRNASLKVTARRVFLHPHNTQGGIISIVSKQSLTIGNYAVSTVYISSQKFWEFVICLASRYFASVNFFSGCSAVLLFLNVSDFQERFACKGVTRKLKLNFWTKTLSD